jgi:inosine-uridine nucleoside N-ribohydrolase
MRKFLFAFFVVIGVAAYAGAQTPTPSKVIFDTDIGDDIDDAYALALLLQSPELEPLGITTAFGDTHLRARLASRFLKETGHTSIPVFAGPPTHASNIFSQAAWARQFPDQAYPDAIAFMVETIRKNPGEITLISVAPFTNVGALIAKDPETFRKLKRVVIMGGSVNRGYGDPEHKHPDAEWNVQCDIPSAKALFNAGVPLYVMPLDSTQIPLDAARRRVIFGRGTPLTNVLRDLTQQWTTNTQPHQDTPTLFDPVAVTYAIRPELCPTTRMRLEVDDRGFTRKVDGPANVNVCLSSNTDLFFDFYLPRVTQ